jgi:hypothetical protein
LDPRISYEGIRDDYDSDPDLKSYLETAKEQLHQHYDLHYANRYTPSASASNPNPSTSTSTSTQQITVQKVNFVARYKKDKVFVNELDEYFKLPREDFDTCDPLKWWVGRQAQFPNVYRLAGDILAIPGAQSLALLFLF